MEIFQTPVRISSTGGVERYVHDLSCELHLRGHTVTIICAAATTESNRKCGYQVKPLVSFFRIANTEVTPSLLPILLSRHCDLIHTHLPTPWTADISVLAGVLKGKPVVLTFHNEVRGNGIHAIVAEVYNHLFLPFLLALSDKIIITRSHHMSPYLLPYSHKLVHIPPGVDTVMFQPEECPRAEDFFFLSVLDRYHAYKGIDVLFEALRILKFQSVQVRVCIGGEGPLRLYYQERADELGIGDSISFLGYVPEARLRSWYCSTRACILPSTDASYEGFGLVLLEAMACGRPVITTNIAGMAEDIEEFNCGIVILPGNPEELAHAIQWIIEHEKEAEQMGRSARDLVEQRFDWKIITARMELVYSDLVRQSTV